MILDQILVPRLQLAMEVRLSRVIEEVWTSKWFPSGTLRRPTASPLDPAYPIMKAMQVQAIDRYLAYFCSTNLAASFNREALQLLQSPIYTKDIWNEVQQWSSKMNIQGHLDVLFKHLSLKAPSDHVNNEEKELLRYFLRCLSEYSSLVLTEFISAPDALESIFDRCFSSPLIPDTEVKRILTALGYPDAKPLD